MVSIVNLMEIPESIALIDSISMSGSRRHQSRLRRGYTDGGYTKHQSKVSEPEIISNSALTA